MFKIVINNDRIWGRRKKISEIKTSITKFKNATLYFEKVMMTLLLNDIRNMKFFNWKSKLKMSIQYGTSLS